MDEIEGLYGLWQKDETAFYKEIFHKFEKTCLMAINDDGLKDCISDIFNITPHSRHLNYFICTCLKRFNLDHLRRPLSPEEIKESISYIIKKWDLTLDFKQFNLITKRLWGRERFTLKEIYKTLLLIKTLGIEGLDKEIKRGISEAHPMVRDIILSHTPTKSISPARIIYWPRYPNLDLDYFDTLLKCTANELKNAWEIAFQVTKCTHRPILTLHNATLGAPSGWGIPPFKSQLKGEYEKWLLEVIDKWMQIQKSQEERVKIIVDIWLKRIIKERILFKLHQLNANLELTNSNKRLYLKALSACSYILSLEDLSVFKKDKFAHLFVPNEILIESIFELAAKYLSEMARMKELLFLLAAIVSVSKRYFGEGKTKALVIPVIDKFIRSSYGGGDVFYTQMFIDFIKFFDDKIIFLFFDETTHPKGPALKEAIKVLNKTIGVKGLGVYGQGERDIIKEIIEIYPYYSTFVLSTHHNNSIPKAFNKLIKDYDTNYLNWKGYHPGWKDGLSFLFEGTRVELLTEKEPENEVILTDSGPVKFGVYFRKKLKEYAGISDVEDPFWTFYSLLANLH